MRSEGTGKILDQLTPLRLPVGNVAAMTEADIVANMMLGTIPRTPLPKPTRPLRPARELVAEAMLAGLMAGPCLVPFSGGRDSSAGLALAVETARRNGLPDPIPATIDYDHPEADGDRATREQVVSALGLNDWERVAVDDGLQLLGPVARDSLRDLGLLYPAAAYAMQPLLQRAKGGTLMLVQGASDFFYYWRCAALAEVLAGRRPPHRADLRAAAFTLLPASVRRRMVARQLPPAPSWLRPDASRFLSEAVGARIASAPLRFDRALNAIHAQRCYDGAARSLEALAARDGAAMLLPFYSADILGAIAAEGGVRGFGDRTHALVQMAGGLLPESVLRRADRINLIPALFGRHTQEFAASWSGGGLDPALVDADELRAMWLAEPEHQDWRTSALIQLAWLHDAQVPTATPSSPLASTAS